MDHYAKLLEVSKNATDRAAALPYQEIAWPMQEQSRLLLRVSRCHRKGGPRRNFPVPPRPSVAAGELEGACLGHASTIPWIFATWAAVQVCKVVLRWLVEARYASQTT